MAELRTPNFLGSMISGLQAGRESQVLRAKQAQEIAAAQERQALNQMIQSGALTTEEGRNALLKVPGGLPILEAYGKLQEQSSKATQEETKGLEGRMQYWRRLIPADARLAPAWVEAAYADPIVGSQLSQLGSKEDVIAGIPRDPEGYMRWAEGASMFADELSKRRTVTAEDLLPYNQPMTPEVFEQQKALRAGGAPRTTIQMPVAETEYSRTVAKSAGEADIAAFDSAQKAATALVSDYEALDLLRRGQPATGITSDLELQFNRIKAAVGKDKEAVKKVKDTELLNALLGQDVFTNIQSLGIGARGLDTPAEREFLREVVSGTIALNRETLIKMAELRAKVKERAIDAFNKRVEGGELDRFFQATGRPKRGIEKPKAIATLAASGGGKSYATEAEAEAAFKAGKLKRGDRVTINGVSGTWK